MILEGLLLTGVLLQVSTLLREGLSPPRTNVVSLLAAALMSALQLVLSIIFSILYLRRGKRSPMRLMIFLFLVLCILVVSSVWTFPILDTLEYKIHTFGNLFVLAGAVGTASAVILKREFKLPDKVASVVKRVFFCGVASVLLTPSVMHIDGNVAYFSVLLSASLCLMAPAFGGFVKRTLRPLYLKCVPVVYLGLLIASCVLAPGYYKKNIKTAQDTVDGQVVVDIVMAVSAGVLGLVAQTLLFIKALSISTQEDESFSQSSENEKLVVPDEVEYSSTIAKVHNEDHQSIKQSRV